MKLVVFQFIFISCLSVALAEGEVANKASSEEIDLTGDLDKLSDKDAESVLLFIKALVSVGYSEKKLHTISHLVEKLVTSPETANVTLVASQNIYNDDASLKEIRTFELAIPRSSQSPSLIDFDSEDNEENTEFDSSDIDQLVQIRDTIYAMSLFGLDMEFGYESLEKDGTVDDFVYIDKDTSAYKFFINRTIHVPNEEAVDHAIKEFKLKEGPVPLSVLKFDKEGTYLKDDSTLVPECIVSVESDYGDPKLDVIKIAEKGLAESSLEAKSKDEVPAKLLAYMEKHVPGIAFFVTVGEHSGHYVFKDYSVTLAYNWPDFADYVSYSVYGYNTTRE